MSLYFSVTPIVIVQIWNELFSMYFPSPFAVFIRIVAGAIIYFEAYLPQNIFSTFEKINILENPISISKWFYALLR